MTKIYKIVKTMVIMMGTLISFILMVIGASIGNNVMFNITTILVVGMIILLVWSIIWETIKIRWNSND